MKLFIFFALALATTSAFDLRGNNMESRNVAVPISATKGRITNGKDANEGQFPYQVGLSLSDDSVAYQCGGSLIDNSWVLTAAHCTENMKKVIVYLGANEFGSFEVAYTVKSSAIIIHSGFNSTTLANDISLIKIPNTTFTTYIKKVRLPAISSSYPTYAGKYATASGWGRYSDSYQNSAQYLQWGSMPVISNANCTNTYGSAITPYLLCVATPDYVSTCQGDSGGPLVLEDINTLIGVTSFGAERGCELRFPVAFTRVTSYMDWIHQKTGISN